MAARITTPGRKIILKKHQQETLEDAAKKHLVAANRTLALKFHVSKETIRQNLLPEGIICLT